MTSDPAHVADDFQDLVAEAIAVAELRGDFATEIHRLSIVRAAERRDRAAAPTTPPPSVAVAAPVMEAPEPAAEPEEEEAPGEMPTAGIRFSEMELSEVMQQALAAIGFSHPSPVQAELIPRAIKGGDLIGQAKTGTGKTAAYVVPILERLDLDLKQPQALVLAPTRELVQQVYGEVLRLRGERPALAAAIYGGATYTGQLRQLSNGAQIVVGSPGRVFDLISQGALRTNRINTVVLDEADQMLDIGFRPQLERILRKVPAERQTMLLSATMPGPVRALAERYMRNPESVNLSVDEVSVETIEQRYITSSAGKKFEVLLKLLVREKPRQCLIFCQMKSHVRALAAELGRRVRGVMGMQGDLPQGQRNRVMEDLRKGHIRILVATDVVGRGIDVRGISHVINYDLPEDPEQYVHRIGRTGRMGRDGMAFSLVTHEQGHLLTNIERFVNKEIARDYVAGTVALSRTSPSERAPVDEDS